jgi:2-keto-4-pentenoate hydratase
MSLSNFTETAVMDALFNNASASGLTLANRYVKLHTGDPGETGTANPAGETTRKSLTGAATTNGVFTSTNDLTWTSVSTSETYSHVSVWDNSTAGNCVWSGAMAAPQAVTAGNTFVISAGSFTATLD